MGESGLLAVLALEIATIILCAVIGRKKGYSGFVCGLAGLLTGPLALLVLFCLREKKTQQTAYAYHPAPAASNVQTAAKPQTTPPAPAPKSASAQKSISEIRVGEAFMWRKRPAFLLDNGNGDIANNRMICRIADFKHGPSKMVYFPVKLSFRTLNLQMISVKQTHIDGRTGEREFTDANGKTVKFRPYIWAEYALDAAGADAEVLITEYDGKYYVVDVKTEDARRSEMTPTPSAYISEEYKDKLILIDNEMFYYESDGFADGGERVAASIMVMSETDGFTKHIVRRYSDSLQQTVLLHFDDRLPISPITEVQWQYLYCDDDGYCFMNLDDYGTTSIPAYRLPSLPDDEDIGTMFRLTLAFAYVIRMERV
ncbi:MAG: hypothetical protein IJE08_06685 [Clostridia bacterium]|nr:hypothetical protein [Clostridia bacterium]